jgi:GT2 family glycosyltransferase
MQATTRRTSDAVPSIVEQTAVVICTRHRPPMVADAVQAVLQDVGVPLRVIVVDQSGRQGDHPLERFVHEPKLLRYRHSAIGLSRARNVGTAIAETLGATVVAFTDDDCIPEAGWLHNIAGEFARSHDVGLVYGSTKPAHFQSDRGGATSYVVHHPASHRGVSSKARVDGMGSCMAVRISAWRSIEGFDDQLGAGTELASAEENDLCMRMLLAGFTVTETPSASVIHHGYRDGGELDTLIAGYMRGSGAAMAKLLRLGGIRSLPCFAAAGSRWIRGDSGVDLPSPPRRGLRLQAFLSGAIVGLTARIDRRSGRFLPLCGPDDLVAPADVMDSGRDLHGPG